MRKLFIILLLTGFSTQLKAQGEQNTTKEGFFFGVGVGGGLLSLTTNDTLNTSFSTTIPNIKLGYFLTDKLAVISLLPGATYKYNQQSRGFEAFQIGAQFWIKEKWWILVSVGLTFDAPAFYTVKDPKTAKFYVGFPAISIASAYEIWHKNKFSLDLQYRFFYGNTEIQNDGKRSGFANMLILGFNWY